MGRVNGAEAIAAAFARAGMPAVFGVPGGGSSLDLLAACHARGIPFRLARTETGAAIMALTTAELTGRPCGVAVTRGPGLAAAMNGLANADLERAPVVLVADGLGAESAYATHQALDQVAMAAPVTRHAARVAPGDAGAEAARALAAALAHPRGPAYLELTGDAARAPGGDVPDTAPPPRTAIPDAALAEARRMLGAARRPVAILGLEAATQDGAAAARALVEALGCPALVTYKAKGVLPDTHALFAGVFTGGAAEAPVLREADLILLLGADPVEFIPLPWRHAAPVLDLAAFLRARDYREPALRLAGAWEDAARALAAGATRGDWDDAAIARHRAAWLAALENGPSPPGALSPSAIVRLAQEACRRAGADPRASVDAGAHMFPCTTFWQAERPGDVLISNGLATMGHALPAGIAAALHDPARGAIAFTGDGGLLMALGELATAAVLRARLVVVVFNDASLSLIAVKTGGRALPEGALGWPEADFAAIAGGLGIPAWRAHDEAGFSRAMDAALAAGGPALVDARCDPSSYARQIAALRG